MAVVSAIRVGGEEHKGNYDFTWIFFWLEVEACIVVAVVSLTAFLAIFKTRSASRPSGGNGPPAKPWHSSSIGKMRNREKIHSTDDFTGTSSTRRGQPSDITLGDDVEEAMPLGQDAQPQGQQDVHMEKLTPRNGSFV